MKKLTTFLLVLPFAFWGFSVQAQSKTAIVESQQIMENLPEYKGIIDQLSKLREAAESEFAQKYQKLQDDYQDYDQKKAMLTAEKKKSLEADLTQKQQELQQFNQLKTQELQKKQVELSKPLFDKVLEAIEVVAKKEGYTLVLDKSNVTNTVLYADGSLDITFKVLDYLKTGKGTAKQATKSDKKN